MPLLHNVTFKYLSCLSPILSANNAGNKKLGHLYVQNLPFKHINKMLFPLVRSWNDSLTGCVMLVNSWRDKLCDVGECLE